MRRSLLILLVLATGIGVSLAEAQSQATEEAVSQKLLNRKVSPAVRTTYRGIVGAFESALSEDLPGGVVAIQGCKAPEEKMLRATGDTLGEVLDSMIKADSRYRWTIEDGVVDLVPTKGLPPLLKTEIENLEINNPGRMDLAGGGLFDLPEVRQAAARLGLRWLFSGSILSSMSSRAMTQPKPAAPPPLHLRDVTVFAALNEIVRANKAGIWIYNERYCRGNGTFNVSFSNVAR